jgi:GTP cyclohydrolase IA
LDAKTNITWTDVFARLREVDTQKNTVYGVPKGGMIITSFLKKAQVTHSPEEANIILDDLIDSGRTKEIYKTRFPNIPFFALFDKRKEYQNQWLVMPWEADHPGEQTDSIQQNIVRQLQYIGEDPNREGLKETPNRIVRSWKEIFAGYNQDPSDLLTTFSTDGCDQIVLLKDIEMFSMCEHHLLPFWGKAHIAYIPGDRVIGISKLARVLDVYARRAQIQERIGEQVTMALMKYLQPQGAACVIEAVHLCMRMRGVSKQGSTMVTSSMKGVFFTQAKARQELLELIR